MTPRHESLFTYSISKPYPFRWFTPVVVIGAIIFTTLFSFLNFVSNGYDLIIETSADPNKTVSDGIWFKHWPSYLTSKVQPKCQSADIPVNSLFFTNQTALKYSLERVWQETPGNKSFTTLPSLTYFNNPIKECNIVSIEIDLESLGRTGNQLAYSEWGASVHVYLTCGIDVPQGPTLFNLTTIYEYVPNTISYFNMHDFLATNFLDRNNQTRASLYWGESLMSMYWVYLTRTMSDIRHNQTDHDELAITKGTLSFIPHPEKVQGDLTKSEFFDVIYRLVIDKGGGDFDLIFPGIYNESYNVGHLNDIQAYPNIWTIADDLAKSTYSTVLTDLGQITAKSNILTDGNALQSFTSNFSVAFDKKQTATPGPATEDYNTLKGKMGPLGTTPSVISTSYICQVPQRKSAGNVFVAVLIADLVFLQALWKLFVLTTDWFFLHKRPGANDCQGCSGQSSENGIGLRNLPYSSISAESTQTVGLDKEQSLKRRVGHKATVSQEPLLSPYASTTER